MKKVLTIAGSDSSGGAGIQADLKTFQELEVYGMSALTAVTAQNTLGVQAVYPMTPEAVSMQIDSIGQDMGTDAIKTGMLFNEEIIQAVSEKIKHFRWNNIVVDPVMIAKGGESLLQIKAVFALKQFLLPLATVITPNIPEAEVLTDMKIRTFHEKKEAARRLLDMGVKYTIIKGGHDENADESIDLIYDGEIFTALKSPRIHTKNTHGTGCTFSAAIAAGIARGSSIVEAASTAKKFIQSAIEDDLFIGKGHGPTNHWAYKKKIEQRV